MVCVLSGSNNDITRMEDIKERAMRHQGLKHYFMVTFNQRPGALTRFSIYREAVAGVMGRRYRASRI